MKFHYTGTHGQNNWINSFLKRNNIETEFNEDLYRAIWETAKEDKELIKIAEKYIEAKKFKQTFNSLIKDDA